MRTHHLLNLSQFPFLESVILTHFNRPTRTMQIEYSLETCPYYVDVRWPMIVWIDHDPKAAQPKDCGHSSNRNIIRSA